MWENGDNCTCTTIIETLRAFLYSEISETRIRGENPISYSNNKIKYLGLNQTNVVKDLYLKNYTTLKKKIRKDTNKWKHVPCP